MGDDQEQRDREVAHEEPDVGQWRVSFKGLRYGVVGDPIVGE